MNTIQKNIPLNPLATLEESFAECKIKKLDLFLHNLEKKSSQ